MCFPPTQTWACRCGCGMYGTSTDPPEELESLPPSDGELGAGVTGVAVKFWPPNWQSTEPTPAGESFREITLPV
jgi:hypothetical protein